MADESKPASETPTTPQPAQQQQAAPVQIPVDVEHMVSTYANFFRVTGTPEAVKLTQRLVMSFYTAKRLLNALQWAVSRYEGNFGVLETDFNKRLRPQGGRGPGVFG